MIDKKLIISGFASTPLVGGSVAAIVLSQKNPSTEITQVSLKDKLIKQGYKESTTFGPKITLLKQYSDFKNDKGDLSQWCKKQSKISEEDDQKLIKEFKEICFETIASKIELGEFAILKVGTDGDQDTNIWPQALTNFRKNYQENSESKPSDKWTDTEDLENFKKQCKTNEREPFFDEDNQLFKEVKKYCTRKKDLS